MSDQEIIIPQQSSDDPLEAQLRRMRQRQAIEASTQGPAVSFVGILRQAEAATLETCKTEGEKKAVVGFRTALHEALRGYDLSGVIAYLLESPSITAGEVKDFLMALPLSCIAKLLEGVIGKRATGVHAILSIETNRRTTGVDYTVDKLPNGQVTVHTTVHDEQMSWTLTEWVDVPAEPPLPITTTPAVLGGPEEEELGEYEEPIPPIEASGGTVERLDEMHIRGRDF